MKATKTAVKDLLNEEQLSKLQELGEKMKMEGDVDNATGTDEPAASGKAFSNLFGNLQGVVTKAETAYKNNEGTITNAKSALGNIIEKRKAKKAAKEAGQENAVSTNTSFGGSQAKGSTVMGVPTPVFATAVIIVLVIIGIIIYKAVKK